MPTPSPAIQETAEITPQPTSLLVTLQHKPWYRWVLYAVANLAFTVGVMLTAIGIVIPEIMRDFTIQAEQMGQIISAYSYTYALMQIPGGLLADRLGPRKTMSLFLLIGGGGILLFSQAPNFPLGIAGRVLTAMGVGVLFVNQIKVLRGWFKPAEFATAMGIGSSINSIGGLVASPLLALMADSIGWRSTFSTIGLINLGFAALAWIVIRDRNPAWPAQPDWEEKSTEPVGMLTSILTVIRNKQFIILFFVALLAYGGIMGVFFGWGFPVLIQGYGLSRVNAAWFITGFSLFGLISAPLWGRLSDKVLGARKPVLIMGIIGSLIPVIPLALFAPSLSILHLVIIFAILGLSTSALVLAYTMANELVSASIAGVASAVLNMGPYIGSGIYQFLAGMILGEATAFATDGTPLYTIFEYQKIFLPSIVAGAIALLLVLLVRETMNQPKQTTST